MTNVSYLRFEYDTVEEAVAAIRSWLRATDQRAAFGLVVQVGPNYVLLDINKDGVPVKVANNA